ncbi:nuclear transport factor 2 family protein [Shewanella sp. NFH-SH190041]|uniref:nuclear transport factor 2 family protein n=1 Tax=Shewanella sp. NFH-SH190041 TaxID=2950245 RepID=UPI003965A0B3
MRYICILLAFLAFPLWANPGDMPAPQQLAMRYMQALTEHDYSKLEQFYDRESVFYDRTAGRKYKGERHILSFMRRAHRGVLEYDFNLEHMYNSGSFVVMIGSYHLKGPGEQFGKPGKIIEIAVPGVTTLSLDMARKRVKEHIDLIDYQTMSDQLAMQ